MRFVPGLFLLSGLIVRCFASDPEVTIQNGTIIGRSLPSFKQDIFLGIPYSEPPVRFHQSVPRSTPFNGSLVASNFSSICYGIGSAPGGTSFSEDCLTLNIIRPETTTSTDALPVVIWIHGGGFWGGSGADQGLNGSFIVQASSSLGKPIIFISIQYRLLFFGFPSGNEPHSLGVENLGLLDQRLAFKWVQENIAAFGGDPGKVTIMGESAGGTGILQHLVAYGGRNDNLFRAAIVESGSFYDVPCNWNISSIREERYQSFLNATGCANFDCLRALDTDVLFNTSLANFDQFLPSIDGDFMQAHPVELFAQGKQITVPLLMGVNNDEGNILVVSGSNTTEDIQEALTLMNGSSYAIAESAFKKLFELYPDDPALGVPMNTGSGLLDTGFMDKRSYWIFGDAIEHAPRRWITGLMAVSNQPVYSYRFAQVPYHVSMSVGSTHGAEITYVFSNSNPSIANPLGPRASDGRLAKHMTGSWVSFIYGLNPNFEDTPVQWLDYRDGGKNMVFEADKSHMEDDVYRREGIELLTQQRIEGCSGLRAGV